MCDELLTDFAFFVFGAPVTSHTTAQLKTGNRKEKPTYAVACSVACGLLAAKCKQPISYGYFKAQTVFTHEPARLIVKYSSSKLFNIEGTSNITAY
jgi:hypothetical protein